MDRKIFIFLIQFTKPYFFKIILGFVFLALQNYLMVLIPGRFNHMLVEISSKNRQSILLQDVGSILLFVILMGLCMFFSRIFIFSSSRSVEYDMRRALFSKLLRVDESFYKQIKTGDLISRSTNDLGDVQTLVGQGALFFFNALMRFFVFLPVFYSLSPKISLVISSMIIIILFFIFTILPRLKPIYKDIQVGKANMNNEVWQSLIGLDTFHLYGREEEEKLRLNTVGEAYMRDNLRAERIESFSWPFFVFLIGVTQLVILWMGGKEVMKGSLTLGDLFQYILMLSQLTFPILSFGWLFSIIQEGASALERLREIFNEKDEQMGQTLQKRGDFSYEIKNLHFSYFDEAKGKLALSIEHLFIYPGEFLGITGGIGSGKTTLLHLLSGILKPNRGQIFVNGIDFLDLDMEAYKKEIAITFQDNFLFFKSIEENVAFSEGDASFDNEKVEQSLKRAYFYEEARGMKEGLSTLVGERGMKLSGGQAQRLSIARAFYSGRKILFFDDAFSALDSQVEQNIGESLLKLKGETTLILASHRLSSLKFCDRILVFKEGSLVEEGSHEQLREKKGYYEELFLLQSLKDQLK